MMYILLFTVTLLSGPDTGEWERWELGFDTRDDCEMFEAALMKQMIDYQYATHIDTSGCRALEANEEIL